MSFTPYSGSDVIRNFGPQGSIEKRTHHVSVGVSDIKVLAGSGVRVNRNFEVVSVAGKLTTTLSVVHAFVQVQNGTDSQWKRRSSVSWCVLSG